MGKTHSNGGGKVILAEAETTHMTTPPPGFAPAKNSRVPTKGAVDLKTRLQQKLLKRKMDINQ